MGVSGGKRCLPARRRRARESVNVRGGLVTSEVSGLFTAMSHDLKTPLTRMRLRAVVTLAQNRASKTGRVSGDDIVEAGGGFYQVRLRNLELRIGDALGELRVVCH